MVKTEESFDELSNTQFSSKYKECLKNHIDDISTEIVEQKLDESERSEEVRPHKPP